MPAECYCGAGPANLDPCENPDFQPSGACATVLRAGAGAGATNKDVLDRFFDFNYPVGHATVVADEAFRSCNAECF